MTHCGCHRYNLLPDTVIISPSMAHQTEILFFVVTAGKQLEKALVCTGSAQEGRPYYCASSESEPQTQILNVQAGVSFKNQSVRAFMDGIFPRNA